MHIAIDYTPAIRQMAGIGRYTRGLVAAIAEIDRRNRYTLFCAGGAPAQSSWPENFSIRVTRLPARWLAVGWHRLDLRIPVERLIGPCDVFHSPDFTLPPLRAARGIVTIHDLSFLRMPEHADPGLQRYLAAAAPRAVKRAQHVLADSQSTKSDLQTLLSVPAAKISVVAAGVDERFRQVQDADILNGVRERYNLPQRFILFLGTIEPRKNLRRLISAHALLRCRTSLPHALVIAGAPGWLCQDIFDQVARDGLGEQVLFPGFIADEDLPALYTLADLFVFPSLYEGFGLPPLEAMACGTPVVTSNNSSLPEATGSAAMLVDAEDVDALADAMARVLGDGSLQARLADLGRAQAARFTWRSAAERLLDAYERLTG